MSKLDGMTEDDLDCTADKKLHAKTISKIFKFVAVAGLVACALLKWLGVMPGATIGEICTVWGCVYGLGAGTIDLNIMFDKFSVQKGGVA